MKNNPIKTNMYKFHTPICLIKMTYANSTDPDQTAPVEKSDQGQHNLSFHLVFCGINA